MRTTVDLDEHILGQAKELAAARRITLSNVIEEALREAFMRRAGHRRTQRVALTTDPGGGGVRPGVDLADNAALRDLMDPDHDSL